MIVSKIRTFHSAAVQGAVQNASVFETVGTPRHPRFVFAGSLAALFVYKDFEKHNTTHGPQNCLRGQGRYVRVEAKERQVRKPSDSVPETFPEQSGQSRDKAGAACGCRNFCQGTPPALSFPYGQRSPGPVKESSSVRHV